MERGHANCYEVFGGRVLTRSLEAHIVDHCNLRCRQCCSLSPYLKPSFTEPEQLEADLNRARRVLSPTYFKLVGGEPLLHPKLVECIEAVRRSGIADVVSMTTNGVLLPKAPDQIWNLLDHMTVSVYPKPGLSEARTQHIHEMAQRFDVQLNIKVQDRFEHIHLDQDRDDPEVTEHVFSRCWLRRRCHLLRDGRFYTCTVPVHYQSFWGESMSVAEQDGLELHDGPDLVDELKAFLERDHALVSCRRCLGGTGELFAHQQLSLREVENREL